MLLGIGKVEPASYIDQFDLDGFCDLIDRLPSTLGGYYVPPVMCGPRHKISDVWALHARGAFVWTQD